MGKKQERRDKAAKQAAAQAEEIIATAVATIAERPSPALSDAEAAWVLERKDGCTGEEFDLGCQVRRLREAGEPWWSIAQALDLEGAGPSAVLGKKGASRARTAYAKAFGSFPRTFIQGRNKDTAQVEKSEHVKAMKATKVTARRLAVKRGANVIDPTLPDDEVRELLRGRRIKWLVTVMGDIELDKEACVHKDSLITIEGEGDDRMVTFREQHRKAPIAFRGMQANYRTVRLNKIYSVK